MAIGMRTHKSGAKFMASTNLNFLTLPELLKTGILPWTDVRTIRAKIINEKFPALESSGRYYFQRHKVEEWLRSRNA